MTEVSAWSVHSMPFITFCIMIGYYLTLRLTRTVLVSLSDEFIKLSYNKQTKCVIYILELLVSPILLVLLGQCFQVLHNESLLDYLILIKYSFVLSMIYISMYVAEMFYDHSINTSLLFHHLVAIAVNIIITNYVTRYPCYELFKIPNILILLTASEFPSFILMLNYRLNIGIKSYYTKLLFVVYYLVSRMGIMASLFYYFAGLYNTKLVVQDSIFWSYYSGTLLLTCALFFVQLYVSNIYMTIIRKKKETIPTSISHVLSYGL